MLIAVLLLALLGLWTPIAVALIIFREWERANLEKQGAKLSAIARHPSGQHRKAANETEVFCGVCGARVHPRP